MSSRIDELYGEGAEDRLRGLLREVGVDLIGEGASWRVEGARGERITLGFQPGVVTFAGYRAPKYEQGFLTKLTGPFSTVGKEWGITYRAVTTSPAFERIGFTAPSPTGGATADPERMGEYHAYRNQRGKQPGWHKRLKRRK